MVYIKSELQDRQLVTAMRILEYWFIFLLYCSTRISVLDGAKFVRNSQKDIEKDEKLSAKKKIHMDSQTSKRNPDIPAVTNARTVRIRDKTAVYSDGTEKGSRILKQTSLLSASSGSAGDYLALNKDFENYGQGKHLYGEKSHYKHDIYNPSKKINKRDHEYKSRIREGHSIARPLLTGVELFGVHRPENKISNSDWRSEFHFDKLAPLVLNAVHNNRHHGDVETSGLIGDTDRNHPLVMDNGYGSRIEAADLLVNDLSALEDVFGTHGPGKK